MGKYLSEDAYYHEGTFKSPTEFYDSNGNLMELIDSPLSDIQKYFREFNKKPTQKGSSESPAASSSQQTSSAGSSGEGSPAQGDTGSNNTASASANLPAPLPPMNGGANASANKNASSSKNNVDKDAIYQDDRDQKLYKIKNGKFVEYKP